MRKLYLVCIFIFMKSVFSIYAQEPYKVEIPQNIIDCLFVSGKDTSEYLSDCECMFLNYQFKDNKDSFDFCNKRLAFFRGSNGTIQGTKKFFFDCVQRYDSITSTIPPYWAFQLFVFDANEVIKTGYDAAIIMPSKSRVSKRSTIKRLSKKHKRR